jgi:hypothetical protein
MRGYPSEREELLGFLNPLPPDQFAWGYPEAVLSYVDLDPSSSPPSLTVPYLHRETAEELYRATIAGGALIESDL